MSRAVAWIYLLLTAIVILFQLAVAFGAPWGELTQGGRYSGTLPTEGRAVALLSIAILLAFSAIVAARARIAFSRWEAAAGKLIWVVVAFAALGSVLNAITPSVKERLLWLPIVLVTLFCSVYLARHRT